jgi:hypothetical protein
MVNGRAVASRKITAVDRRHSAAFEARVDPFSWLAVWQFPQLQSDPIPVIIGVRPSGASRRSALWCIGCVEQLSSIRGKDLAPGKRDEARKAFKGATQARRRTPLNVVREAGHSRDRRIQHWIQSARVRSTV